jgi:hypothetical protein
MDASRAKEKAATTLKAGISTGQAGYAKYLDDDATQEKVTKKTETPTKTARTKTIRATFKASDPTSTLFGPLFRFSLSVLILFS